MNAKAEVDAGICGFRTTCCAQSEDDQNVMFSIESDCEKIRGFAAALKGKGAVDAFSEISAQGQGVVLPTAQKVLKGCCAGCVVPVAIFKSMQVAAGLALPKDIAIKLIKD